MRIIVGLFRFIGRMLAYVWLWIDALRRSLVNLVFLLVLAALIGVFFLRPEVTLPDRAALLIRPKGALVEQRSLTDPLDLLRATPGSGGEVMLADLLEAIHAARDDQRIQALVIETDDLDSAGLSKLLELRSAIAMFKESGKPVIARGERFTQAQYLLASAADEVHLSPDGFLLVHGMARFVSYFKGALDQLGIKVHVFRVGEYKSFSEPFTRAGMSEEDRSSTRDLLDALWNAYRTEVSASRKLDMAVIDRYVQDYAGVLQEYGGNPAAAALGLRLVDQLTTRDQWHEALRSLLSPASEAPGDTKADPGKPRLVSVGEYLGQQRRTLLPPGTAKIAVLVAQGSIVDGKGAPGSVGGDSLAEQIRAAREDDSVRAVVLRIDSPGGSAWASEVIRRELHVTRLKGKPVIASMSSTAASGGYWIAAGANEIWAHPTSLTGSIGVFALFPEFAEPLNKLGITVDGVATGPLAGVLDPRRPLAPAAAEAMQIAIEHGYQRFLQVVAEARDMDESEVDLVGRGQVWTGEAAEKLGLVDHLGGLNDAIRAAAQHAQLDTYEVVWPAQPYSLAQLLLQRLGEWSHAVPSLQGWLSSLEAPAASSSGSVAQMLTRLQRDAADILRWNDPQHMYSHCLCSAPE